MTNDALLHPIRALKLALRRALIRADKNDPFLPTVLPPALERFAVGESVPIKGTWFKVGKIIGGDFPVMILIPTGRTKGATLHGLRNMRDIGRAHLRDKHAVAKALAAETRG